MSPRSLKALETFIDGRWQTKNFIGMTKTIPTRKCQPLRKTGEFELAELITVTANNGTKEAIYWPTTVATFQKESTVCVNHLNLKRRHIRCANLTLQVKFLLWIFVEHIFTVK